MHVAHSVINVLIFPAQTPFLNLTSNSGDDGNLIRENQTVTYICSTNGNRISWAIPGLVSLSDGLTLPSASAIGSADTENGITMFIVGVNPLVSLLMFAPSGSMNEVQCQTTSMVNKTITHTFLGRYMIMQTDSHSQ